MTDRNFNPRPRRLAVSVIRGALQVRRAWPDLTGAHNTHELAGEGIEAGIIDLKTLIPYDIALIVESVEKTGRLVIIHEASETLGFGAELAAQVQKRCFGYLEAPIDRICAPDLPYSYRVGDEYFKPNAARIRAGLRRIMEFSF